MKKTMSLVMIAAASIMALVSCEGKKEITSVSAVKVQVNLPEGFKAFNGEVKLVDRATTNSYAVKAEEGVAEFTNVEFGIYDATVSCTMSAEEFTTIAPDTVKVKSTVAFYGITKEISIVNEESVAEPFNVDVTWSVASALVFSRIYNFGTQNLAGKAYNIDKYWEIYNNSDEVQYVDGLLLGEAYGSAVMASPYTDFDEKDVVYLQRVVKLPGTGKDFPIEPGKSIVIAQNAKNHIDPEVITMTVDLSKAEIECYIEGAPASMFTDNVDVPNVTEIFGAGTYQAKFGAGQGCCPVLFAIDEEKFAAIETVIVPGSDAYGAQYASYCKPLSAEYVIDAVDMARTSYESRKGKHMSSSLDASWAWIDQKSIAVRKAAYTTEDGRVVLSDTNNSEFDFEEVAPAEGQTDGSHLTPKVY